MGEDFPLDPSHVEPPHEDDQYSDQPDQGEGDNVPVSFVRNEEKAEVMAHAENDAHNAGEMFPQNASLKAGHEYDMQVAQNKAPSFDPNKVTKAESDRKVEVYNIQKRNQTLRYSNAIVEHYKQSGDKPTTSLAALAAVHELTHDTIDTHFETGEDRIFSGDDVRVTFDKYERVVVEYGDKYVNKAETFTLSMLHGSSYEVAEEVDMDPSEGFDYTTTIRTRLLTPHDVKRLKEIISPAIAFRAEQQKLESWDEAITENEDRQAEDRHEDDDHWDDYDHDIVTPADVHARARAHFGYGPGADEMVDEAARLYPGDFM